MILVVTANSRLGDAVARQLLADGRPVRGLVRSPEKGAALAQLGAEIVTGDLRDPDSLRRACQGATAVVAAAHSLLGGWGNRSSLVDEKGHCDLIDAAQAAGVGRGDGRGDGRFIYISGLDVAPDHPVPFLRHKAAVEQYLQRSGLNYLIIRPSAFMETHAHQLIGEPLLTKGKVSILGQGDSPRNFVAVPDVAKFVVMALAGERVSDRIIEVGAPGNYSNNQVARLYAEAIGRPVKIGNVPAPMVRMLSLLMRLFQPGLSQVMGWALHTDSHGAPFDPAPTLAKYPLSMTTLPEFVRAQVENHP
jgi:uncharacterized protein YbjT (DUF2867 family)